MTVMTRRERQEAGARRLRQYGLCATFLCLIMLLALRLAYLQLWQGPALAQRAVAQRTSTLPLALHRGTIYDRDLRALHAPLQQWQAVVFAPFVEDPQAFAADWVRRPYAPASLEAAALAAQLEHSNGFVRISRPLSVEEARQVLAAAPEAVTVVDLTLRYGPSAVAPHVIGTVNARENRGTSGLELQFDEALRADGQRSLVALYDAQRRPLGAYRFRQTLSRETPFDLVTTLDYRIQEAVERELAMQLRPAAAVVVDAKSGDILALASHPSFAQERIAEVLDAPAQPLLNRALRAYPLGSVFKIVVAGAALEAGVMPDDVDWREALARSDNQRFYEIGQRLGAERIVAAALAAGFGRPTGIPLPGEQAGVVGPAEAIRYPGDLANLSMGQGPLSVTPLQVAQLLTAVVNHGELQPLRLVQAIRAPNGETVATFPVRPRQRLWSTETAGELRRALREAVLYGTGRNAEVRPGGSAGKTGTAETGRRLADGRKEAHAWFAGYAPATAPRYIIVVMVESGMSGGDVAAPLFRNLAEAILIRGSRSADPGR